MTATLAAAIPISDHEFSQLQQLIYQIAGITLGEHKKTLVTSRLGQRLEFHGLSSWADYYRMVIQPQACEELQILIDLLTTHETYFFREPTHFDFLTQTLLPQHPLGQPFDIWSAAASSGEEIYSLCFALADTLGIDAAWSVTGSDISTGTLTIAEKGEYRLKRTRGMPESYLRKYCLQADDADLFAIDPKIKNHTRFRCINLNRALPNMPPYRVIFLRNVMIYFDVPTKTRVIERLQRQLLPGGYLIVGLAESLIGIPTALKHIGASIYQAPV